MARWPAPWSPRLTAARTTTMRLVAGPRARTCTSRWHSPARSRSGRRWQRWRLSTRRWTVLRSRTFKRDGDRDRKEEKLVSFVTEQVLSSIYCSRRRRRGKVLIRLLFIFTSYIFSLLAAKKSARANRKFYLSLFLSRQKGKQWNTHIQSKFCPFIIILKV